MREKPTQGHSGSAVAPDSNPRQLPNFKETTSQSFDDDENEWELGVGNLIIDLDADLERNSTSPISGQQPETTSPKMSGIEHQATVDKGLKMKIKRKSGGAKSETKHEIVKHDKMASIGEIGSSALSPVGDKKLSPGDGKDKLMKGARGIHKKDKSKEKTGRSLEGAANMANGFPGHGGNSNDAGNSLLESDKLPFGIKRESVSSAALDPYEFNAKVEDRISMPVKKIKLEKNDLTSTAPTGTPINQMTPRTVTPFQIPNAETSSVSQPFHDASTETSHVGTITEPECLGPCEPGTSVSLEGIVWQETENGVLVVNVTWRGKTYVGTLMDSTKHDWAPPRFTCDSPTSDFEARTPKGRGKRGARGSNSTPLNDMSNYTERKLRKGRRGTNNFQAPPSPAKSDVTPVSGVKRKGRPAEIDLSLNEETSRSSKRNRSNSRSTPTPAPPTPTSNSNTSTLPDQSVSAGPGTLIQCPEPNCNKKYRHINGLRYHQSHAHMNNNTSDDKEDSSKSTSSGESRPTTPANSANTANNSDQTNGTKTPIKRTTCTRESESKSKSRSDSASEKSKDDSKESLVTEDKKSDKCETIPMETIAECEKKVVTVTPVTSQVYQISGGAMGRLGGISVLPKPVSEIGMAVGVPGSVSTVTAVTVPITTVATLPVQGKADGKDDKKKKVDKIEKVGAVKPSTITRPIVPAPMPQNVTLTTNGPITHSTLTAVTAHAQISPTLKAIQPKPTVMGEPSIINPALAALKEKKPKHKKKNKEKERSKSPRMKDDSAIDSKAELTSVIKSVSASTAEMKDGAEKDKLKSDAAKLPLLKESDIKVEPGTDSRVLPPSSLSLTTRLEVSTPDPTDHGSESVQSPAYSDISDAADSAPSLDNEVDIKQKDKPSSNESPSVEHNSDSSLYGMYPYYGQAPYLIPAIPQSQAQTQPSAVSPSAASTSEQPSSKTQESKPNATVSKPPDRLEEGKEIKKEPMLSPQLAGRDYRVPTQQQKLTSQSMYGHPQYQYLTAFGYIDPAYHMHLMNSDPNYREKHEKFMEDQERLRKEQLLKQDREKTGDKDKGNVSPKPPPADPGKAEKTRPIHAVSPMVTADQNKNVQKLREPKLSPHTDSKDKSDLTLKEKQNENLQILKENMDLKPQMDNRPKPTVMTVVGQESYDQHTLLARQREELQRYYMYQQQKLHERNEDGSPRTVGEGPKGEGKKPENKTVEQLKDGEKGSPRDSPVVKREQMPSDLSKKDSNPPGDRGKSYRDKSDERRPAERTRTVDDKSRTRSPNVTPKLKTEAMPSTSMASPTAASVIPAPAHYAQYLPAGYLQSPHAAYAQFPYDPASMYRHGIIGYPPGAGYPVHPGHPGAPPPMRYHVSPMDLEREKSAAMSSQNTPSPLAPGEQPKALDLLQQHASHYYSSHKIHELEKARPVSSPGSKPSSESSSPSVPTSSYQKPREYRQSPPPQRHVHTHHHTHLVGGYPGIPPYDPYSAIIVSGSVADASSINAEPLVPVLPKQ